MFVGRFVDRNANAPAWVVSARREQAGVLAFDVEETDLPKVEQLV